MPASVRFSVLFIAAWEFIPWRFADRQQKLRAPLPTVAFILPEVATKGRMNLREDGN